MSTTLMDRIARRKRPTEAEVAEIHRLWRESPADLYGVRRRFIAYRREQGANRLCGPETILRYRPADLAWPTPDERGRNRWSGRFAWMDGPPDRNNSRQPPVVDALPPRKKQAEIDAERMQPSRTDPTPDEIAERCRQLRRERGEIVLLEIDLR